MAMTVPKYQDRLWRAMRDGALLNSSSRLKDAYTAAPRHQFIGRYRTWDKPNWRENDLNEIYTDQPLFLEIDPNRAVDPKAPKPSYLLHLVHELKIDPGHRVLEIGSGTGWLVAIMAHLTGPTGFVTGIEIVPDLVKASDRNLANIRNVRIIQGDGFAGLARAGKFDRIIATAGLPSVPPNLEEQSAPDAQLILPIIAGETTKCHVTRYRLSNNRLVPGGSTDGNFVPVRL